jgi:serine/threonine protein phosphatase PrpC
MDVRFWAKTDTGRVREANEDNFLVDKRLQLFVVCDGMGGHAAGEVASAVCVRTVRDVVAAERELLVQLDQNPDHPELNRRVLAVIERAIHQANSRIFEMSSEDASRRGMGTTCSMLLLHGDRGYIAHVGDSRIYVRREGRVSQLTIDHSLINEMIRQGKIRPGDDANFPNKNAVTRAVGVRESVEVDAFEIEVEDGDRFLLCSDGLCGYFTSDDQIVALLADDDLKAITESCIRFAHEGGGKDNITVIIVDAELEGATGLRSLEPHLATIEKAPLFDYLSARELRSVLELSQLVEFGGSETVHRGGLCPEMMYVVLTGSLGLFDQGRAVGHLAPGESFGELALIDEQAEELELKAMEPSALMAVGRASFMELLRTQPSLAVKLLWNLLQGLSHRLRQVPAPFRTDPARWADAFISGAKDNGPGVPREQQLQGWTEPLDESNETMALEPATRELVVDAAALHSKTQPMGPPPLKLHVGIPESAHEAEEDLRATVSLDWELPASSDAPTVEVTALQLPSVSAGASTLSVSKPADEQPDEQPDERRNAAMARLKARVMNKPISGESVSSARPRVPSDLEAPRAGVVKRSRHEPPTIPSVKKVVIDAGLEAVEPEKTERDETVEFSRAKLPDHD